MTQEIKKIMIIGAVIVGCLIFVISAKKYTEGFRVIRRSPLRSPWGPPDISWGGGFRQGPAYFAGGQYGPLPPSRRPYGGRCDCHYQTGHIRYHRGKCYRPWGPKVDPRDSCFDLRNF